MIGDLVDKERTRKGMFKLKFKRKIKGEMKVIIRLHPTALFKLDGMLETIKKVQQANDIPVLLVELEVQDLAHYLVTDK